MAKLLMLGGCGQQAQPAFGFLLENPTFDEIIIGDIDLERAQQIVAERQHPKLRALLVDVLDHSGTVAAMQNMDVVYNCTGPYHLLGLKVLRAAIEAGIHYVDFCDDVQPTLDMLALNDEARSKGVTAIVGLGASPGYFNLLAKQAADKLDSAEEVNMYWAIGEGEPEGPAVMDHNLQIMTGYVTQFLDGKETLVRALSGQELEVEMPLRGKLPTGYVGHPEPLTLWRHIPGLKQIVSKYAAPAEELAFIRGMDDLGLLGNEDIVVKGQSVRPRDVVIALMQAAPRPEVPPEAQLSMAILEVKGKKGGVDTCFRYTITGHMAPVTSIPAALGAIMLAHGDITETGVMPPEACVPPKPVLRTLVELGLVQCHEQVL